LLFEIDAFKFLDETSVSFDNFCLDVLGILFFVLFSLLDLPIVLVYARVVPGLKLKIVP